MIKSATAILSVLAMVAMMNLARSSSASAAPAAQSTPVAASSTPTDEPPKPPYVFPTPIFIPTFPGDTPSAPAALRTPGQPTGQTTYIVQSGDSPWVIAQKVYGNGSKYPLIMSANALTDSTRLRVGMTLKIPSLEGVSPASTPETPSAAEPTDVLLTPSATRLASAEISATPVVTRTAPAGSAASVAVGLAGAAINLIVALLLVGALVAAILAFLIYSRTRRLEELNPSKRGLQIRK